MKKLALILLTILMLALSFPVSAYAEDTSQAYQFELSCDGLDTVTAAPNQIITATLTLERNDSEEAYSMYGMQAEIVYDASYFELVEDSIMLYDGIESTDLGMRDGSRRLYMNFVSLSGATQWDTRITVGTFQLKVLAESGVSEVSVQDYLVSTSDGADTYTVEAKDLSVVVSTDCIVEFVSNGGSEVPEQTVIYGERIVEPNEPQRDGYYFVDWCTDIDLKNAWDFDNDTVAQSMKLYAHWSDAVVIEDDETPLAGPEIPWWVWLLGALLAIIIIIALVWLLKKQTVVFDALDGQNVRSVKARWNTKLKEPEAPVKDGETFVRWYKDKEGIYAWDFEKDRIRKDTILYAKWSS